MAVHIGLLTSEVHTSAPRTGGEGSEQDRSAWEERARLSAQLERLARDRRRTATGHDDD